jgi:coenzyme F420 biosynthesis associated uncharacterized protein
LADSYLASSLRADFARLTEEAEGLVAAYTGLSPASPARAEVLDRAGWIDANVVSMRHLLGPLMARSRAGSDHAPRPITSAGRSIAGTELGVLMGWFAARVLGQYDLLVPDDAGALATDAVYYVGTNVLGLEKRFAFRPRDFRLWIAIHEVTHRAQFSAVPWMRDHFVGLVARTLGSVDADPRRLVRALVRAVDELRRGRDPLGDGGLVGLLATPEQRDALGQVQALMSVLEGHGNRVMNELGREHVVGQERMARVLQARRQVGGLQGFAQKALGLETKMRQYEVGERFLEAVEREAGPRAIDYAWQGPEFLPTLGELQVPSEWLARVRRDAPTSVLASP